MEVYFSGDFCGQVKGERAGTEIPIRKRFCCCGYEWLIPAAYSCRQGLILDVLRKIPVKELRRFKEKWGKRVYSGLSKEESVRRRSENPTNFPGTFEAVVNGRKMEGKGWIGIEWTGDGDDCGREERALMDFYGLDPESAWYCCRTRFLWPEKEERIHSLEFTLRPRWNEILCGCSFDTEAGCPPFDRVFTHPFTGREMRLHVKSCTPKKMDEAMFQGNATARNLQFPEYYLQLEYSVEPEPGSGEAVRVGDCAFSDPPVIGSASAAGVIGGAQGPAGTTIDKKTEDGMGEPAVQQAFSSLHFKPELQARWYISVQRKQFEAMSVMLIGGGHGAGAARDDA